MGDEASAVAAKLPAPGDLRTAMSSTAQDMAVAAALLDRVQTGQRTQEAQQSALTRLTALIAELDRQAQERSAAGSPPKPPAGKTPSAKAPNENPAGTAKTPASKPDADPNAEPGKAGTEPGSVLGPSGSSEGPATGPTALRAEIERVWGNLPERQRQQVLQLPGAEEFLPKYEALLEEYFKRLAEQQDPGH